ncbi:DUF5937 family protein [Micromonospora sp. CPCC 205556]|uniref:DUF5937 family protein n=1 Tax=Micromonospora sp. CPCC 205556 TaxID=3122398 RepID=UPI002FEF0EBD
MLTIGFSAYDLAVMRFAFSPMQEIVASVRVLKDPAAHALHVPWVNRVAPRVAAAAGAFDLLFALVPVPSWYIPDFVTPPPTTPVPDLETELADLRRTAPERVRADLDRLATLRDPARPSAPVARDVQVRTDNAELRALRADPKAGLGRLAAQMSDYWELAVSEHWPRLRSLLEGDVVHRARRLADGGPAALFADLAPSVSWRDDRLSIAHPRFVGHRQLDGEGLLLVPSAFVWPTVFSSTLPPWQPTLTYPARGVATLWERRATAAAPALERVIGRSRTRLLLELEAPASTTELAFRTGLTPGAVSQHLGLLRSAGLVGAARSGRLVLYFRTEASAVLLTGVRV